jgi:ABC-type branched-subunit amino acid transport system permease subunit/energy-coupling factor transporter ATP-binding protein EcfA2
MTIISCCCWSAPSCLYTVATLGLNIQFGYAGVLNFAGASFFGIGAYTSAVLNAHTAVPHLLVLLIGGLIAALIGSLLLLPVLRTRGHYAALVTIAFALLLKTFLEVNDVLGGPQGLQVKGMKIFGWSFNDNIESARSACPSTGAILSSACCCWSLPSFWSVGWSAPGSGLNLDALRLDETAASCFGLDVARWKITAFTLGNFLIGMAGALFGMVGGFVAPNNYTFADSLLLVSILLLGGIGNPWGLVVATVIVVVVPEKLQTIQEYRFLLYACWSSWCCCSGRRVCCRARCAAISRMAAMTSAATICWKRRGLTRKFGGVVALDHLDPRHRANEILGLIGPNGSGKTTFFNVATGIYGADAGSITFDGAEITRASSRAIYHAGCSRTFQRSRLSLPLSIFDNIMIGNHKRLNQGLWFNLVRRSAFKREFEGELSCGAHSGRSVRTAACRANVRANCRAADDRPAAHRNLPCVDQSAEAITARRAVGGHDARGNHRADGRHPADPHAQQESRHRHRRARDGRHRAHHRPLRGAQFRSARSRKARTGRSPPTARCRKPIWEWPR